LTMRNVIPSFPNLEYVASSDSDNSSEEGDDMMDDIDVVDLQEKLNKKPWLDFVESDEEETFAFLDECPTPRLLEKAPRQYEVGTMASSVIESQLSSSDWSIVTTALIQLGLMYSVGSIGNGIQKDLNQAYNYFMKAHIQKHPRGSYKVGEFIYTGKIEDHHSKMDCVVYFRSAVDLFVKYLSNDENNENENHQNKLDYESDYRSNYQNKEYDCENMDENMHFFGETEFQYMLNDFRNGLLNYPPFYEIVVEKQNCNKYLMELVEWTRVRRKIPVTTETFCK